MNGWPVSLRGVTESVVTTRGPDGRYNVAALGVHAPDADDAPTARTWGRTRTRRNLESHGEGHIQFVRDPVLFVDAAIGIREVTEPVLPSADAWVRVRTERIGTGQDGGTEWADWRLHADGHDIRTQVVPTFNRGYAAVVEATVAASRLGVAGYDETALGERIDYFEDVAMRCGGPDEHEAFSRLRAHLGRDTDEF